MLKPLAGHGMVNYGTDLVVMGGYSKGYSSSFYQLSVENGIFNWEKMKPELKIPRSYFVAMTIPDDLVRGVISSKFLGVPTFFFRTRQHSS